MDAEPLVIPHGDVESGSVRHLAPCGPQHLLSTTCLPTDRGFGLRPSFHFGGPSTPSVTESPGERGGFSGGVSGLSVLSPRREGLGSQRPGATYSWLYPGALPRDSRLQ